MSRPTGTPLTKTVITLYVDEDSIITVKKRRFVLMSIVDTKIAKLCKEDNPLKHRYLTCRKKGCYNIVPMFGMRAIDIDGTMVSGPSVSVDIKIKVGEGKDEARREK